jgi:serine/threonine-protein kinase
VALKVLHKELARRPEVLQRFVEEAQIGGQLQHPGIVPVYELGLMADERPYFTMKLVKGRTLAALLADRAAAAVDRRRLLDTFESICQTMAYAHSRGVIHRDLKPANVMVGAFGEVQVVDWGLAKVLRSSGTAEEKRAKQTNISIIETVRSEPGSNGSHSLVGSVMGTPAYMSPEQARGEIEKLDERSDVFSLGAILCEVLTGQPPYTGEQEKTLVEAANAKLEDATERLNDCEADPELVALCSECLAPAPSARPRSAEVLAQRIHGHLVSVEERARRAQVDAAEARVKAQEERRARKLTIGLAASALVTVLVAGGGWAWMSGEGSRRERDTETQVNVALNEATLKRGEGQWAEALAAAERAKGLADSGAASNALRARIASDVAAIESDAQLARAKEELVRGNDGLLAELADVRQPDGDKRYPTDWARLDADHLEIFKRRGFDLDEHNRSDGSDALIDRGIPVELAAALDEWAFVRSRAKDKAGADHLLNIARDSDTDATRTRLRDALRASDVVTLKALATNEDLAKLPATTLLLLGKALRAQHAEDEGLAVLRKAQELYPGDYMLAMSLARALFYSSPSQPREAARYYTAARALRPNSVEAAHELGMTLVERLQEPARAMELFRDAVARHPDDAHLRAHLASCLRALERGDEALAMARAAKDLDPKDAYVVAVLSEVLVHVADYDAAVPVLEAAADLDPESISVWWNLGTIQVARGELDAAIAAFRKIILLQPHDAKAYAYLGTELFKKDDLDGAAVAVRKAIDLDLKNARAHSILGCVLLVQGDIDGALEEQCMATELDPLDGAWYSNLGDALLALHDLDGAAAAYLKNAERDPSDVYAWLGLAGALQAKGDVDSAIRSARIATSLAPYNAKAHSNLGSALLAQGDIDGALEEQHEATQLDPLNSAWYSNLGNALLARGDFDDAVAAYHRSSELDPKDAYPWRGLAAALQSRGAVDGAIRAARKAIEVAPRNPGAHSALGALLTETGDVDGAIAEYRRAIELDSKDGTLHGDLGTALRAKGHLGSAIGAFLQAIELNPGLGSAHAGLGRSFSDVGEYEQAISYYSRAVELDSNDVEVLNGLSWLLATCPNRSLRDGPYAVILAERETVLAPASANSFNDLGAARCCAGEWRPAIEALERSLQLDPDGDRSDRRMNATSHCLLATAHAHLDNLGTARPELALALAWHAAHPGDEHAAETARFLDDARAAIEAGAKR